jgi:hypothetical protein
MQSDTIATLTAAETFMIAPVEPLVDTKLP